MAELRAQQGQILSANATRRKPIKFGLPLKVLVPLAAGLLLISCAKGIKQNNEGVNGMGNTGSVLISAEAPKQQAPSDTLKTVPKLVSPDVRTLEHYAPFCPPYNADSVYAKGEHKRAFMLTWFRMEDTWSPFGLRQEILDSYSQKDKAELMLRWERAKTEIRVAFLTETTPATVRTKYNQAEIDRMEAEWQKLKGYDKEARKVHSWKWDTQRPSQR